MNSQTSRNRAGHRNRTILTGAILALSAAVLVPIPASAAPATHDVTLYGDGNGIQCTQAQENNEGCRGRTPDFYVAPGRVLAASGDTIRIANWGKGKAASYSPTLAAPANFPSTPSNGPSQASCPSMNGGSYSIDNPCVISFVWTAPPGGSTTVTFGSDGSADSKCPLLTAGGCFNKLVITNIPSQYPPAVPVVTSPVAGSTINSNNILLEGHSAANGKLFRAEVRSKTGYAPVMYEFYGFINGFGGFKDTLKNLVNGDYRVTLFSRNHEGFESKAAPIVVSVRGLDIQHPVLAWDPIQTVKGSFLGVNYTTSPISVSGVLRDDVRAKSVVVTVSRNTYPTSSTVLTLRCTRGYPENSNETVPCDSATNPQWVKWNGTYVGPPLYGSYSITVTVSDGVHPASSQTRSVTLTG